MNGDTIIKSIKCGINKNLTYLDVSFCRKWKYIPVAMSFIEDFLSINSANENIHKVGMASSELLENAIRYSNKDCVRITVQKEVDESSVYISILNFAEDMHAKRLLKRVKEMNKYDSLKYYLYRMRESIKNKGHSPGLGLARIYHEAGAEIKANYRKMKKIVEVIITIPI